jgi:hypothetical protein
MAGTDGGGNQQGGNTANGMAAITGEALSDEAMRGMYFKLLLKSAAEGTKLDADMLDRMERLVNATDAVAKSTNRGRKTAGSTPANPPAPASQEEG